MSESNEVTLENWEEKKIEFRVVDNGVKVVDLTNWEESLDKLYYPAEPKNSGMVDIKVFIKYLLDLKEKEYMDMDKVTRLEVIDDKGRSYVGWKSDNNVKLSFQDEGRTLKIFITKR